MNPESLDKIILVVLVSLLFIAIAYTAYINMVNPRHTCNDTRSTRDEDERIVLVVNKSINEWREIYRKYVLYSDEMYKKHQVIGGEYNLTQLLRIISNANSSVVVRTFYFHDPIIDKYVVLKIVIPLFVVELHIHDMPQWGSEPLMKEIGNILKKYVEEYPSNYTEYRLALIVLKIASQIRYKGEPSSYDALLGIVYNEGNCETKTSLAIDLAANVGLWSAFISTENHQYLAIAVDNPPPRLRRAFNFTWHNHTFYLADVAVNEGKPLFPIKPYPNSWIETIVAPFWEKTYSINKPLQ